MFKQLHFNFIIRMGLWLLLLAVSATSGWSQVLLTEDFNATTPPYALTTQGWTAHSGAGTNAVQSSTPNLIYSGLTTTGGSASLTFSGEDVNRPLSSTVGVGNSVYASMLINVSSAQATGDYFFHFGGATIGSTFNNRLYIRSSAGGFQLGLAKNAEAAVNYGTTVYSYGTTHFIVAKYTLVTGTANDVANLFVEPVINQTEPAVTLTQSSTSTDLTTVGTIALRQGTAANTAALRIDYIRVGTTWASVTSGSTPTLTANPTSLTGLTYVAGSGPASATVSVSGANLNTASGTVTAASSSTAFTVSPPTAAFSGSALAATPFTVQLVSGLSAGSYSATLTFEGGGATALVPVSGTVTATNAPPNLSINDVSLAEGNAGTTTATFTVTLSAPAPAGGVTFDIATADGTATTANNDYSTQSLTGQTIPAGFSTYSFTVLVNGDATSESNETFFVNITNVINAVVTDGQGQGTITNDDVAPPTRIHVIQGSGTAATSGTFIIEGIVVGVFNGTGQLGGFYVQEENADADGNALTSEGIFVNSPTAVNVGDRVQITGTVQEDGVTPSFNQAVITPSSLQIIGSGLQSLVTPTVVSLPTAALGDLERYEGMLVNFTQTLTVTETFNLGRFGEVVLANGRLFTPTNFIDPNDNPATGTNSSGSSNVAAITAQQNLNDRSRIILDDGGSASNLSDVPYIDTTNPTLRIGSTLTSLTGVMGFGFSEYRIQPTVAPSFTYAPRPAVPGVGGTLKVSAFNVLNYFNGNGAGGGFPTTRGADSPAEFSRQRSKIITAINQLNADVVGLIEIENDGDGPTSAIADLVNGLNTSAPGTYTFVSLATTTGSSGSDEIKVAFIYKPAVVTPVGSAAYFNDAAFTQARPPLAQTFRQISTGSLFTPIINHFKSKGSSAGLPGDTDQGDGQGLSNASRKAQATALLSFIAQVQTSSGDADVMVLGDLNAYNEEDPIDVLRAGGLTKLTTPTDSYVFDGQTGSLDHALVTASLLAQVTGTAKWNINADEPLTLDYNNNVLDSGEQSSELRNDVSLFDGTSPFRSSDHDPVLVGLNMVAPALAASLTANPATVCVGAPITLSATVSNFGASYSYTLTNGTNMISATTQTGATFSTVFTPTVPGAFTLTVLAIGGSRTAVVAGIVNAPPTATLMASGSISCTNGAVELTASGGVSYALNNGATSTSGLFTVNRVGSYTVVVTAANGCTASASATVLGSSDIPVVSLVANAVISCANPRVSLTASVQNGITARTYILSDRQNNTTGFFVVDTPGLYSVIVLADNGCQGSATATVAGSSSAPVASLVASGTISCTNNSATLTASGGISYALSNGQSNTTGVFVVNAAGMYSVTVTGSTGCSATASTSVLADASVPAVSLTTSGTLTCTNGTVTLTASGGSGLPGSGLPAVVSYAFSGNGVSQSGPANSVVVTQTGTYSVVATAANGCTALAVAMVTADANVPTVSLIASGSITCTNTSVTLTASGGVSYALSNGSSNTTGVFVVNQVGLYSVLVTGANGCTATATATVTGDTNPPVAVGYGTMITCIQPISIFSVGVGVSYSFNGQTNTTGSFTVNASGTYNVVVTGANGCTAVTSITVTGSTTAPPASLIASGTITCANASATLTASGGVSYALSNGQSNTTGVFVVTQTGLYSVVVTAANGCTATASATVTGDASVPAVNLLASGTITCANISATLTASGGTNYALSDGSTNTTGIFVVTTAGTYSVTATAANGCKAMASATVSSNTASPTVSIVGVSTVCQGQSIILIATGTGPYRWNTGAVTAAISVSATGTYSVTLLNDNGCNGSASQVVTALDCTTPPNTTTVSPTPTGCGSPTNTIGQPLVITEVTDVSCATGTFRVLTTGGNGQPINYAGIIGLNSFDPYNCVRMVDGPDLVRAINNPNSDIQPFNVRVTQVGGSTSNTFAFNFKQACTSTPPSGTTSTPPSTTTTTPPSTTVSPTPTGCGSPTNTIGQPLVVTGVTDISCATGSFRILTTGGNGQPINFAGIVGLSSVDPYNCVRMLDNPDQIRAINNPNSDIMPFGVRGVQVAGSTSNTFPFDFKAYCTSTTPPSMTTTIPPSNTTACGSPTNTLGQTLRVTGFANVNCPAGTFRILTEGGNGQPISYANIVGLSNDDAGNCVRRLDNFDLTFAVNNPNSNIDPFMLRVMQGGTQSAPFSFNMKLICSGVARTATESMGELDVTVLGNPTLGETVEVVISNTAGERIDLRVSDAKGQLMNQLSTDSAGNEVRQRVVLGRSAGLYLLQVSTPTRTKTVKVVRQ